MSEEKIKCKICGRIFESYRGLSNHIIRLHNISLIDYYNKFIKKENEGICLTCGKQTNFKSLAKGYYTYCSTRCMTNNELVKLKIKNTNIKRYGVDHPWKIEEIHNKAVNASISKESINKRKASMKKKFGTEGTFGRKDIQKQIWSKETRKRREETCLSKYGVKNIVELESAKINSKTDDAKRRAAITRHKNNIEKYGYEEIFSIPEIIEKSIETKRKNGTFNTSSGEDIVYLDLASTFLDTIRNYKSERYPYNCDFYIPSRDLYIECNYHWTHGGHWFDENNLDDIEKLEFWQSKNTKYYDTAIKTWTVRDTEKRNCAKRNNLNYVVLWNKEDTAEWFNLDCPIRKDYE